MRTTTARWLQQFLMRAITFHYNILSIGAGRITLLGKGHGITLLVERMDSRSCYSENSVVSNSCTPRERIPQ